MSASLVGSEMCIRDRSRACHASARSARSLVAHRPRLAQHSRVLAVHVCTWAAGCWCGGLVLGGA
eukprot:15004149-Alexandrium_andersonii.AAC.1